MADIKPPFVAARQGFAVLAIFFFIAPPIQFLVAVMVAHSWVGGQDFLLEISQLIQSRFMPRMLSAYGFYMPVCLTAGLWAAYGVAKGRRLGMGGIILKMVVVGGAFELIVQIMLIFHGEPWMGKSLLVSAGQWIISAIICAFAWLKVQKIL